MADGVGGKAGRLFEGAARTRSSKVAFLGVFRTVCVVSRAAEAVGIPRTTVYRWLKQDEAFAEAFEEMEDEATEDLEAKAMELARGYRSMKETIDVVRDRHGEALLDAGGQPRMMVVKRVTKDECSERLLMMLLRARAPEKYGDRRDGAAGPPYIKEIVGVPLDVLL